MAVSYKPVDQFVGGPAINVAGDTTQRIELGQIVLGRDATYGIGEFIYAKFTGTVAAGDFVIIDRAGITCVQASTTTPPKGALVGVSMGAQTTGCYGFVMIRGVHDGANVASGITAGSALFLGATAGRAASSGATFRIDGAVERLVTASGGNVGTVELEWSSYNGNG